MTTSSSEILRHLNDQIGNPLYNTSYPLSPADWAQYRVDGTLPFDISEPIAFYIHIPFCRQLCSFCEYTRMALPTEELQTAYIRTLRRDVLNFMEAHPSIHLYGFDIGGGTPTALHPAAFGELTALYSDIVSRAEVTPDFEPSIEGTFGTLTAQKAGLIAGAGIHRLSLGVQSSSGSVLSPLKRHAVSTAEMARTIELAHRSGIRKINLDLMYGLPGQSLDSVAEDIETIKVLGPEQVTVYELRTNQLGSKYTIDSELAFQQYCRLYDQLTALGYHGVFGQNTFSLDPDDCGLSSYLRHRMFDGRQYRGFGISAQSMSTAGISYNIGKNCGSIKPMLSGETFDPDWHYALPPQELFAKFIAISGYSGGFSLTAARRIYGPTFDHDFKETIETLLQSELITLTPTRLHLTPKGFTRYGAVLSLFYQPNTSSQQSTQNKC